MACVAAYTRWNHQPFLETPETNGEIRNERANTPKSGEITCCDPRFVILSLWREDTRRKPATISTTNASTSRTSSSGKHKLVRRWTMGAHGYPMRVKAHPTNHPGKARQAGAQGQKKASTERGSKRQQSTGTHTRPRPTGLMLTLPTMD